MKIFKKLLAALLTITMFVSFTASVMPISAAGESLIDAISPDKTDGTYSVTQSNVRFLGRTYERDGGRWFNWNNSGFEFTFYGTKAEAEIYMVYAIAGDGTDTTEPLTSYINVYVDGANLPEEALIIQITSGDNWVTLVDGLEEGYHTITVRSPTWQSERFALFGNAVQGYLRCAKSLRTDGTLCQRPEAKALSFEAIGDSITNGDATWDVDGGPVSWSTWAAYTARYFDADLSTLGISGNGVISWVVGGGGMYNLTDCYPLTWRKHCVDEYGNEVKWDASDDQIDVVMINLGTNDRENIDNPKYEGITSEKFVSAYVDMMKLAREKNPDAIFICMLGAMGHQGTYVDIQYLVIEAVNTFNSDMGEELAWYVELPLCSELDMDGDGILDEDGDGYNDGLGYDHGHPSIEAHKYYSEMIIDLLEPKLTEMGKWEGVSTSILGAQTRVSQYKDENNQPTMDMRFVATVDTEVLNGNIDNIVDIGILVGKDIELSSAGLNAYDVTLENFENATSLGITIKKAQTAYMYDGFENAAQNRYRFYASLVGINHNLYTSTYVARAYVVVDNGDGTTTTRYSRPIKRNVGRLPIGNADVEGSVEAW